MEHLLHNGGFFLEKTFVVAVAANYSSSRAPLYYAIIPLFNTRFFSGARWHPI